MFSSTSLTVESNAWIIDLSEDDRQAAWKQSESLPSPRGRWQTYLSTLSLSVLQGLLTSEVAEAGSLEITPYGDATFLEFVPGAALDLGGTRLVIVPTEALEVDSLEVAQEWVDLPTWHGDYYVVVQISSEEEQLRILGYATHQQIKTVGALDAFDRTYSLEREELIPWDLFEPTYQRYGVDQTRSLLAPLEELSVENAAPIIQRLADPALLMPRLEVPFSQWGAILDSKPLRRQLYQTRRGDVPALTRLSGWLQEQIDSAWQSLELLLPQQPLATARGRSLLKNDTDLQVDGSEREDVDISNSMASNPMVYRAKRLGLAIPEDLALVVGVAAADADNLQILLRLESVNEVETPHDVQLRLLNAGGEELSCNTASTTERFEITFQADPGERFAIEILSQGERVTEHFSV